MKHEELTSKIINLCIKIHQELGPGLLESVYEEVLAFEFDQNGIQYQRQKGIPVVYSSVKLNLGFRADFIVEEKVIVEIKSVESITHVFAKTVLTYMKFTNIEVGLLINFNVNLLKDGITRLVLDAK